MSESRQSEASNAGRVLQAKVDGLFLGLMDDLTYQANKNKWAKDFGCDVSFLNKERKRKRAERAAELAGAAAVNGTAKNTSKRGVGAGRDEYVAEPGGFVHLLRRAEGDPLTTPLTNYTAKIVASKIVNDGAETKRCFEFVVSQQAKPDRSLTIPAEMFFDGTWTRELGPECVTYAVPFAKDHLRVATQLHSGNVPEKQVYAHSGFVVINGQPAYLHGGGALGVDAPIPGVDVQLPERLSHLNLPHEGDPAAAIRASLNFLWVGPPRITVPTYLSVWRPLIEPPDFSVYMFGRTGVFKTALAALIQQHYGKGFDASNPPSSFGATFARNEYLAHAAKDMPLLFDDYKPATSASPDRYRADATRLIGAAADRIGRGRMRSDLSARPDRFPRCQIIGTGEELIAGASTNARMLGVEVRPGDVNVAPLSACQADAAAGMYARTTGAFIQWLLLRREEMRTLFERVRQDERRNQGQVHPRVADITAQLAATAVVLHRFLVDAGINKSRLAEVMDRISEGLEAAASAHPEFAASADPIERFFSLLQGAIVAGRAHLRDADGEGAPSKLEAGSGWRYERGQWSPQGDCIGWIQTGDLFLNRDAAHRAASSMATPGSLGGLEVTADALMRRLRDAGKLRSRDEARRNLTTRKMIGGVRRNVIHLGAEELGIGEPDESTMQCPSCKTVNSTSAITCTHCGAALDGVE